MKQFKTISLFYVLILLVNCVLQSSEQPKIKQGLYGQVTWLEGNLMPSPDQPNVRTGRLIERTLYIHVIARFKDVVGQAPPFATINSSLIKTVKTDKNGYYECEVPIGNYSVFSKEGKAIFFANTFNGKG